jgi:CheY-like chemotaxis protein
MSLAKVLIVEDEAVVARDIQRSLEKLGYSVAAITDNGLDAINLAKQLKPDLIIMPLQKYQVLSRSLLYILQHIKMKLSFSVQRLPARTAICLNR